MIIHQLFPEPVYFSNLDRALTKTELKTIAQYKEKTTNNQGNVRTKDSHILEHKTFKNLKKDLNKKIINYFNEVICSSNSIIPHITQSWINYTKENQFHPKHNHSNSLVSGIFYVSADKKVDSITFSKVYQDDRIRLNIAKYNIFNASSCTFPVETGDILLFKSSLPHAVDIKKGTNIRISLSFNVFLKGTIGNKEELTELVI